MAKNYIEEGDVIEFTNGTGSAISSGAPVAFGNRQMGIALSDIAAAAVASSGLAGVYQLPKAAGAIVEGQKLWWSGTAVLNAPALNAWFIGYALNAQLTGDATVDVMLAMFCCENRRVLTLAATGAITLNAGDFGGGELLLFAPNTATQTINLPSVAAIPPGAKLTVKKTAADAAAITLEPAGSETIAGAANYASIDANNDIAQFVSDGAAWLLVQATIA